MIKLFALKSMKKILNKHIQNTPQSHIYLKKLSGKYLQLDIQGTGFNLFLGFDEKQIIFQQTLHGKPDIIIHGSPINLVRMFKSKSPTNLVQEGDVEIDGQLHTLLTINEFFRALKIDWAYYFSLLGLDISAETIEQIKEKTTTRLSAAKNSLQEDTKEYVQEEAKLLPTRTEVELHNDKLNALRDNISRLEQRYLRIKREIL